MGITIKGNTITNKAGTGDISPKAFTIESSKTYLLIKTDGGTVNIDGVDTAVPAKITGKDSTALTFATGKIGLYELLSTENDKTATELAKKYTYVNGTKSTVSASRLKSVGKNLFDGKNLFKQVGKNVGPDGSFSTNPTSTLSGKLKIKPNTQYKILNSDGRYRFLDVNNNILGVGFTGIIAISPSNAYYLQFAYTSTLESSIQLEQNTVATPYEPYTESISYLPNVGELRSLPNSTKDEIRVSGGKAELVKRVSDGYIFNGNEEWQEFGVMGNRYYVTLRNFSNNRQLPLRGNNAGMGRNTIHTFSCGFNVSDITDDTFGFTYDNSNNRVFMVFSKTYIDNNFVANLTGIKNYLNQFPVTLTYQLAEPIITPIEVSGTLLSNPSGTVYVENVVADAGLYVDKMTVFYSDLPIKEIEKVSKVDFITGLETELDVSQCVVSEDKLSFTHENLVSGDIVFFTYFHDVESTNGETTIEYYDSRYTLKDKTTNVFYQWALEVDNGVPTISLVEVL